MMGAFLIVPGLPLMLTIGTLCTYLLLKADRFYVNTSGPRT